MYSQGNLIGAGMSFSKVCVFEMKFFIYYLLRVGLVLLSIALAVKCYSLNMKRQIIASGELQERNHREDKRNHCLT